MLSLIQHYEETSLKEEGEILYVVHSDNDAGAAFLEEELKKINPTCRIRRVQLTPVIGAHTGPGMCAVVNLSSPELARV
jgi:fatty acid-binding protein DegV